MRRVWTGRTQGWTTEFAIWNLKPSVLIRAPQRDSQITSELSSVFFQNLGSSFETDQMSG